MQIKVIAFILALIALGHSIPEKKYTWQHYLNDPSFYDTRKIKASKIRSGLIVGDFLNSIL